MLDAIRTRGFQVNWIVPGKHHQFDTIECTCHHDQKAIVQISFMQYVQFMVSIIDDFGNPF